MATKRAVELGRRLLSAKDGLLSELYIAGIDAESRRRLVLALERAALAVGEERERGRKAKRKGPRR